MSINIGLLILLTVNNNVISMSNFLQVDFYRINGLDLARCGNKTEWQQVNYHSIGVPAPQEDSSEGMRAAGESCASSFPLLLLSESILELNVLVQTKSNDSRIQIQILDEFEEVPVMDFEYSVFDYGWNKVFIHIPTQISAYINILGFSNQNDLVLFDSLLYKATNSETEEKKKTSGITTKKTINRIKREETNQDFVMEDEEDYLDEDEGSGEGPIELPVTNPVEARFWSPTTISLVSVGSVIVLASVSVAAYFYGKSKVLNNNIPYLEELPPPRLLPRVRL